MRQKTLLIFALFLFVCTSPEKKAQACLEIGDYERAIALYNHILDKNPKKFDARYGLGLALYQKAYSLQENGIASNEIWMQSISELNLSRRIDSVPSLRDNIANAHYRLGVLLDKQGNLSLAVKHLGDAIRENPDHVQALNRMATLLYDQREFEKARILFQKVLDLDPAFIPGYQNLGSTLWALGNKEDAMKIWKAGLILEPENEFLNEWYGKAVRKIGTPFAN